MRIIFHSGPHKTATTAIQDALSANREALKSWGVFVPTSSLLTAGFHELPWSFLGWDTRLLFKGARRERAEDVLDQQLRNAVDADCNTILFSAEDLSLLHEPEWKKIFSQCQQFASKDKSREARILVTFTKRNLKDLVASAYPTLVTLGIGKRFFVVRGAIKRSFEARYKRMSTLTSLDPGIKLKVLDYSSSSFLPRWFSDVIPEIPVSDLVLTDSRPNQRLNQELVSSIRKINRRYELNYSKNSLFSWPTFQTIDVLLARQEMMHELISERPK